MILLHAPKLQSRKAKRSVPLASPLGLFYSNVSTCDSCLLLNFLCCCPLVLFVCFAAVQGTADLQQSKEAHKPGIQKRTKRKFHSFPQFLAAFRFFIVNLPVWPLAVRLLHQTRNASA